VEDQCQGWRLRHRRRRRALGRAPDGDLCAATGCPAREDCPAALAERGHRGDVTSGTASGPVRGQTALRQRPAPVRCRARGAEPGCRPAAASAPPSPSPQAVGLSARSLAPSSAIRAHAQSLAEGWLLARPEGVPLKPFVEKVVTGASQGDCPAPLDVRHSGFA